MKGKQRTRHTLANSCKHTADTGSVSKGNTTKATKPRETSEGTPGQGRYLESIPNDAQHRRPEKHGLALCQGPRQRTQETMSLPATEPNRTRNLCIQASTAEKSPQPDCSLPRCSAVCLAQRPRPQQTSKGECLGTRTTLAQGPHPPQRHLAFCPKEQKGNTRAPGWARPPLPSHPGNTESFPCESGEGFLGVCLPQASPGRCGSQACGPGVSTPQGRVGMAGWGSPGSAGCPG